MQYDKMKLANGIFAFILVGTHLYIHYSQILLWFYYNGLYAILFEHIRNIFFLLFLNHKEDSLSTSTLDIILNFLNEQIFWSVL